MHALAIEGTFDDCQAMVKGLFNHHAFRDRVRLSGVNSINWARIVAQVVYYFTAAVALGAPQRKVAFTVPTGNFGDVFAGYVAQRMGLPIDRLVVATNVNDILARTLATGAYELREVVPTTSPSMDIQVSSNFERLLFEAYGRDAAAVRALMASLAQSRRFSLSLRGAVGNPRAVHRRPRRRGRDRRHDPHDAARDRLLIDPHTAVGIAVAEKETRDPAVPMVVLGTAHPAKFPDAVEAACGVAPGAAGLARRSHRAAGARRPCCRPIRRGRTIHPGGQPCRARRSCRMSVEVTRLPSGLAVVTDAMPHLETASLGVWVGSGSRDERPDEHGISHLLEHMAFKGTARRTARQIAEEIEAVGGDINAATSVETTAYYARVLQGRRAARARRAVRHPGRTRPSIRTELTREQNVIVQEIGAAEDTPDDIVFDHLQATAFPGPAGRPLDPRHAARPCARSTARTCAPISRATIARPDMVVAAAGAVDHARWSAEVERRFASFNGPAAPVPRAGALRRRRHSSRRAISSRCISRSRCEGVPQRDAEPVQPAGLHQRARRRDVVAAVPGGAREARPLLLDLRLPRALCGHRHVRPLCRHRRRRRAGADAGGGRRDRAPPPRR